MQQHPPHGRGRRLIAVGLVIASMLTGAACGEDAKDDSKSAQPDRGETNAKGGSADAAAGDKVESLGKEAYGDRLAAAAADHEKRLENVYSEDSDEADDADDVAAVFVSSLGQLADDLESFAPSDAKAGAEHQTLTTSLREMTTLLDEHGEEIFAAAASGDDANDDGEVMEQANAAREQLEAASAKLIDMGWAPDDFYLDT